MRESTILKRESGKDGYFSVYWSQFRKADRHDIARSVPARSGIVELYYMDEYKKLNEFFVGKSWYGGLRSTIRILTDPELDKDERRLVILNAHEDAIYYRYAMSDSNADLDDVHFFLIETLSPGCGAVEPSGRFDRIFVNEYDAGKLVTI